MATTHRGSADKPGPSEYVVKHHPGAKPGDWQGHYEPVKNEKHKQAAQKKFTAALNAAATPPRPVNVAKLVREVRGSR